MKNLVTTKVERKKGGMRRYMFLEPYWSDIGGQRFLSRFIFFFTPWAGCHVTRIHMADDQREWPHDHSATFLSWRLFGSYEEDVFSDPQDMSARRHRRHRWLSASVLRHDEAHSITRVSPFLVTVVVLGKRRQASNYWTPDGKQGLGLKMDEWS